MSALAIIGTVAASLAALTGLLTLQGFWIKQSLDALSTSLNQRITDLDAHLSTRLDRLEERVGRLEEREREAR